MRYIILIISFAFASIPNSTGKRTEHKKKTHHKKSKSLENRTEQKNQKHHIDFNPSIITSLSKEAPSLCTHTSKCF